LLDSLFIVRSLEDEIHIDPRGRDDVGIEGSDRDQLLDLGHVAGRRGYMGLKLRAVLR
jgi:hypothetical protein